MVLDCPDSKIGTGQYTDYDMWNPFIPGALSRTGKNFLLEPLYFYNVYRDELIPWIAESHEYGDDFTEVTIRIREGVEWSDGEPWTARDLAFTIGMLKADAEREKGPALNWAVDMRTFVRSAEALDERTARIAFNAPAPRFVLDYLTSKFCMGMPIVPEHVWRDEDPREFRNLDIDRGWPVVTGPYRLAVSTPEQKVYELRRDWWAAKAGFQRLPKVERLVYLTYMGDPQRVQNLVADRLDSSLALRAANMEALLEANPNVTSWTGRELPYGYLDHWPVCLGFNCLEEPFSDPDFRRAVGFAIDRRNLVEIGLGGAGEGTLVPFPEFPPIKPYVEGVRDLFERRGHGVHDPSRTAEIMEADGWTRDGEGFWTRGGRRAKFTIEGYVFVCQDFGPVLAEQLRRAGFEASYREAVDFYSRMTTGQAKAFLSGMSASVRDPYATLRNFHARYVRPTGESVDVDKFWRWRNEEFSRLVDEMGELPAEDPRFTAAYRRAMEIWLAELPAIPVLAWHQRVPHNTTHWTGWPSAEYPYVNSAYWHNTWLLVLLRLEPAR
jgi:peptide/nickel transport system substrate-binding protein